MLNEVFITNCASRFLTKRTMRLLLDTRGETSFPFLGLGIDTQMAIAIYRVGTEQEYAEVGKYKFLDLKK